jgi:hypothetical protein
LSQVFVFWISNFHARSRFTPRAAFGFILHSPPFSNNLLVHDPAVEKQHGSAALPVYWLLHKAAGAVGKRRWHARTPRPVGTSVAPSEREASWSAERRSALAVEEAPSPNVKNHDYD